MENKVIAIALLFLFGCTINRPSQSQASAQFSGKYSDFLQEDETEIQSGYYYVTSKNSKGDFIYRRFFPETKQITELTTYKSSSRNVKNGIEIKWTDEGVKRKEGFYVEGKRNGVWKYFSGQQLIKEGGYVDNKEDGLWKTFDEKGRLEMELFYKNGLKEGKFISYDTLSNIINQGVFQSDSILSQTNPPELVAEENKKKWPLFYNCGENLSEKEKKICAQKEMLQHMYKNIRYPSDARYHRIEGTALVNFIIDKDGSVKEIRVINGLCKSIAEECKRMVGEMPDWYMPAMENGVPIAIDFILPIKFKLE